MAYQKKRMLNRLLLIALALLFVMLFSLLCSDTQVWAKTESGKCGKNVKWTLTDKGVLTISGTGAMKNYKLMEPSPWYYESIKSIKIESGVTTVGDYAFYNYNSDLKSITLPNTLKSIGEEAFYECDFQTIIIPDGVNVIGSGAFSHCTSLKTVKISDSVKKKINIINVFYETPWLLSNLPKSGKCGKNIKWTLNTKTGTLTINGKGAMYNYSKKPVPWYEKSIKSVNIKPGVTIIGNYAFEEFWWIKKITLPKGLTKIGYSSFRGCRSLTSIKIPDSVTSIDGYAFYECQKLKKVTFPKNLTYVGISAFETEGKAILKTIIIPSKKIKTIEQQAFGWAHDDEYTSEWKDREVVIKGYPNTASEKYAKKNKFKFVYLKKVANTLKIKGKTVKIKRSKLKKKKRTLKVTKTIKFIKKGQGKKTYTKISGNKKIMINKKTGKVTIKKGLKKRTYKVKIKVRAAGNAKYKALTKTGIIKIKVI